MVNGYTKLSSKRSFIGKSVKLLSLSCDEYANFNKNAYLTDPTLTRKASSEL